MHSLTFEEREIVQQVMAEAWPLLTRRQAQCLRLQLEGLTQAEVAGKLGISQVAVYYHLKAALRKVGAIASAYL